MSTFDGIVSEFPDIRIDFFRQNAGARPPLACFLSHVHSDHLAGLESLRSPFVYCSAATREILLRLERYPCRINYAKGILEARQQTFKHLNRVLKALPLETPTTIELCPGRDIQVTLFDANHCPGAVMFLVEGDNKAILYTGDIRSEPWFVNTISRNPNLVEYTSGLKTLDKIYLDTSFTEDMEFQTKAQGIAELLHKVSQYPNDTVFHFQAWTYGYEDVWVALSKALKSRIHVDGYKLRIYGSLKSNAPDARYHADVHLTPESPALTGHMCGNTPHPGCLTSEVNVRLHSCEKGNMCEVAQKPTTVSIQPIIAHLPTGEYMAEVGVGGGGDDLRREAELDFLDQDSLATLFEVASSSSTFSTELLEVLQEVFERAASTGRNIPLDWDIETLNTHSAQDIMLMLAERIGKCAKTQKLFEHDRVMQALAAKRALNDENQQHASQTTVDSNPIPSSPVNESQNTQHRPYNAEHRFVSLLLDTQASNHPEEPTAEPEHQLPESEASPEDSSTYRSVKHTVATRVDDVTQHLGASLQNPSESTLPKRVPDSLNRKRTISKVSGEEIEGGEPKTVVMAGESFSPNTIEQHSLTRKDAYWQMIRNITEDTWTPIRLISTSNEYTTIDQEL
ncbi:hypothetical protein NW762_002209 [Fusarium torreyae]|uniref:Metallo-beta-lactamase domain-containing protein n=1 Tax=Fusarium torreyae TaxID=1237075 RepID=A0A9W8SDZ0_9HYPO|nr:hypothetical protein NW762_002209 [Fusarium torreyae]